MALLHLKIINLRCLHDFQDAGFRLWYLPASFFSHIKMKSSSAPSAQVAFYNEDDSDELSAAITGRASRQYDWIRGCHWSKCHQPHLYRQRRGTHANLLLPLPYAITSMMIARVTPAARHAAAAWLLRRQCKNGGIRQAFTLAERVRAHARLRRAAARAGAIRDDERDGVRCATWRFRNAACASGAYFVGCIYGAQLPHGKCHALF